MKVFYNTTFNYNVTIIQISSMYYNPGASPIGTKEKLVNVILD